MVDYYEKGSCPGDDTSKCNICTASYLQPNHELDVDYRVDSRAGDTTVVYVWIYNLPRPDDEK
jgi:hypothetical protein